MVSGRVAGMSDFAAKITEAITLSRVHAEALMQDRVKVWRASGEPPTTGEWGKVIPAPPTLVYDGPAKAQNDRTHPGQTTVADSARAVAMVSHVHFPHGTTQVGPNDVVEWVASINPRLVGRRVRISVDQDKTWNSSARLNVAEVIP